MSQVDAMETVPHGLIGETLATSRGVARFLRRCSERNLPARNKPEAIRAFLSLKRSLGGLDAMPLTGDLAAAAAGTRGLPSPFEEGYAISASTSEAA